jgi:hypothetical protein
VPEITEEFKADDSSTFSSVWTTSGEGIDGGFHGSILANRPQKIYMEGPQSDLVGSRHRFGSNIAD